MLGDLYVALGGVVPVWLRTGSFHSSRILGTSGSEHHEASGRTLPARRENVKPQHLEPKVSNLTDHQVDIFRLYFHYYCDHRNSILFCGLISKQ